MERLESEHVALLFLAVAVLLASARILGEIARRLHQPAIAGEILAGVLLGPTVLGHFAPAAVATLFPHHGPLAVAMDTLTTLAIALFLLVAGMEVDLSTVWRQGRVAISVATGGMVASFTSAFAVAWFAPALLGQPPGDLVFALFFATALSMSALPVVAKTLMDLDLYRSDFGMVVIAAAVCNDLIGWIIFAVVLGMAGATGLAEGHAPRMAPGETVLWVLAFAAFVLTLGRWLIDKLLPWVQAHTAWPGGVLTLALTTALLGASFTEWIGVHAIFGAFLVGVALGDSAHLREQTRLTLDRFISFIFAPLFFASVGLRVNFIEHLEWVPTLTVLVVACGGMVLGCGLGAQRGGMRGRQAWAVGFGMNARGAMEIIIGLLALQLGLIEEPMFVALVVMALVTSMMAGPAIKRLLKLKATRKFTDLLTSRTFVGELDTGGRGRAIRQMCAAAAEAAGLDKNKLAAAVVTRERLQSTGLGNGIAVPHARIEGLRSPLLVAGTSNIGIDFDAPDGAPAHLIFLLLTNPDQPETQLETLADIARTFHSAEATSAALKAKNYTQFLAHLRSGGTPNPVNRG